MQAVRTTVDLSPYPDLVMVLLGFRVGGIKGIFSLIRIGAGMRSLRKEAPSGLLRHEQFLFGWNHVGIRQYWRDFDSLERFTRTQPHRGWWRDFSRDSAGNGFWHETYAARGGVEAIYIGMARPPGLGGFAPLRVPTGSLSTARGRLGEGPAAEPLALGQRGE